MAVRLTAYTVLAATASTSAKSLARSADSCARILNGGGRVGKPKTYVDYRTTDMSKSGKTYVFAAHARNDEQTLLGHIKWYGPWRRYVFYPAIGCLFDPECLRDLSEFTMHKTTVHYDDLARKAQDRSAAKASI